MRKMLLLFLIALTLLSGCAYQVVENASHVTIGAP